MDPALRIVTRLPLPELWTERGAVRAARERTLGRADVKALLQAGPVQFVVADVGKPLRWVPPEERYVFWKADARDHIVENPRHPIDIYAYREGYAQVASEWIADELSSPPIIVLERHHQCGCELTSVEPAERCGSIRFLASIRYLAITIASASSRALAGFCEAARHVKPQVSLPTSVLGFRARLEMLLSLLFALTREARKPRRSWVVRRSGSAN